MAESSEIIVPDLGLFSHFPPEAIPRKMVDGKLHIGLHYCRNISLSRKAGCIKKSKGVQVLTSSATGAADSVRGIGILNKYARPQNFESANTNIEQVDGSVEDVEAKGTTGYSTTGNTLKAGSATEDVAVGEFVTQSSDDCLVTNDATIDLTSLVLRCGGQYDFGARFQSIAVAKDDVIVSAYIYLRYQTYYGTPQGDIYGEDVDDAATFSTIGDFTGRTKTTAKTAIGSPTSTTGFWYKYDVTAIVQEIVNRAGWATGQDMAFLGIGTGVSGGDYYQFYSFDDPAGYKPYLHINVGSHVSHHIGLHFDGFAGLVQGDKIESARVKVKLATAVAREDPTLRIYGHDADTAWRDTGTHDGGNNEATVMTDSTASWVVDALIGLTIKNVTDGSTGTITDNDATTVTVAALTGGTDDDWDTDDAYEIYNPTVRTVWDGMQDHLTTAYVDWTPDLDKVDADGWLYSPDITAVIKEIVDRAGWDGVTIGIFIKDNSSDAGKYMEIWSYDGDTDYAAYLEVTEFIGIATTPTYFMFVDGGTEGEIHKLDGNLAPSDVSQVAETYANAYQSQIAKFLQFGHDMIFSDDGKSDVQMWDASTDPTNFIDAQTTVKGRYLVEFKARQWVIGFCEVSGVLYIQRAYYSAVDDPTSFADYISFPGSDFPTFAIPLNQDQLIVFKESSSLRIVDRQTTASDFQPYVISSKDGSLGANVVSDGARLYGINEKGVFQWPVAGHPNGFRYISKPIQDEIDKVTVDKMNLVGFAYNSVYNQIIMNYPNTESDKNSLAAVLNIDRDSWENISDIWHGNVMVDAIAPENASVPTGTPIIVFGQEDGHLKNIGGDDNEGNDFTGELHTGALWLRDREGKLVSRELLSIEPISNYDGSMTLNFFVKGYDRPNEETTTSWEGPYTHQTLMGNEERVPIKPLNKEKKFHKIKIEGTLKDEAFEIQELKLTWNTGTPT